MIGTLYQVLNQSSLPSGVGAQAGGNLTRLSYPYSQINMTALILALVIYFVVITLFGKWIWNNVLAKYVSIVSPIESLYEFWLLVFLLHMIFPANLDLR